MILLTSVFSKAQNFNVVDFGAVSGAKAINTVAINKAILICNNNLAFKILKWKPLNSNIKKIIRDEIRWYNYLKKKKILRKTKY